MTLDEIEAAIVRIRVVRDRGVTWLLNHVADDGEPVGARERNGWARLPWALAVAGEKDAAARVIAWAERGQLALDGGFAPGPALGTGRFGAYPLSHLAIGAWLTERFGTGMAAMAALRRLQDPETGGFPIAIDGSTDVCDLLSTAQAGLAAVIAGHDDIADGAWRWIADMVQAQPANAGTCLYTFRKGASLVAEPDPSIRWLAVTDFAKPRQTYYTPGMAAVFLTAFAKRRGRTEPLSLARRLLAMNIDGCAEQFDDPGSVQLCKFGWGAAAMLVADADGHWLSQVVRMVEWFAERQDEHGAWAPSTFLVPEPTDIDRLVKTAEHVMEVDAMLGALGTARGRAGGQPAA